MNKELIVIGVMILMLVFTTSLIHSYAQNATTNASNTVSNATALVNQTLTEVGQNVSAVLNNTSEEVRLHTKGTWTKFEQCRLRSRLGNIKRDRSDR